MDYTLEQAIEIYQLKNDILPFKYVVTNRIIKKYLHKYGMWYITNKYSDLNINDIRGAEDRAFADIFYNLSENSFFYNYKTKNDNLEGYIYSVLKNIFSDDNYNRIKSRIITILNEYKDLFSFWNLKEDINNKKIEEKNRYYFHNKFKEIPPEPYMGNLDESDPVELENFHKYLSYLKKEKLKEWLETLFLLTQKSFKAKIISNYFYNKYYPKKEISNNFEDGNSGEIGSDKLNSNVIGSNDIYELTENDIDVSEEDIKLFFDDIIEGFSEKMSLYVYWFAAAMHKNERKEKTDIFRLAEKLSDSKVKRNSIENNIKNNDNSFSKVFEEKYIAYFDENEDFDNFVTIYMKFLEYFRKINEYK
jgi:hypothetical protein